MVKENIYLETGCEHDAAPGRRWNPAEEHSDGEHPITLSAQIPVSELI